MQTPAMEERILENLFEMSIRRLVATFTLIIGGIVCQYISSTRQRKDIRFFGVADFTFLVAKQASCTPGLRESVL
jgi:hypothetical protein